MERGSDLGGLVLGPRTGFSTRLRDALAASRGFIVSPLYDGVFFIFSPLIALALGFALAGPGWWHDRASLADYDESLLSLGLGSFIMAHLVLVLFRSHANASVFRAFPLRFTVVPLALFGAMLTSPWIAVAVGVLATWWDVYHSGLQTFGLGRIYDARAGNDAQVGRRLDYWLNLLLYAGPILAGATLMDHVEDFSEFEEVGSVFFSAIPAKVEGQRQWLTWGVCGVGLPFLGLYVLRYVRYAQQGYRVSFQKVALLTSTALVSIWSWGFNSFGMAFFIMNLFHAVQYFAIVWSAEKKNLVSLFGLQRVPLGGPLAFGIVLVACFSYGVWAEALLPNEACFHAVMVVAIMHFWYDGFIWSVRKKQI